MSVPVSIPSTRAPIQFGTDGWRGVIAADFTCDRLAQAASAAAQVLAQTYGAGTQSRTILVGYDRRFLSEVFAQVTAAAIAAQGLEPLLADSYAPTPALSWAAHQRGALGALVITASHNPAAYSGLKIKGAFGGSVPLEVTQQVEAAIDPQFQLPPAATRQTFPTFDPWGDYCRALAMKVDIATIRAAIAAGRLQVLADVMHGAAAGGLARILGTEIPELHGDRDPLFGGGAPEPLPRYLGTLLGKLRQRAEGATEGTVAIGLVFDGDGDRIAAVNGQGEFLSSQVLIPILIDHLVTRQQLGGEVIKTLSGSDLIPQVAQLHNLPLYETPIGYKYIADRMLERASQQQSVLLGGEESGGIGYGTHVPERDALLSALYLLEACTQSGQDLSTLYDQLVARTGLHAVYDRLDLPLASLEVRARLLAQLQTQPPAVVAGQTVQSIQAIDGYKFRLGDGYWLLIRFSGTEPLLRLYCEAPTAAQVEATLAWAKEWALTTA
ncbi:phosphoglucomutase/phosphomannomutase family protein [Trichothermofontia sp.]